MVSALPDLVDRVTRNSSVVVPGYIRTLDDYWIWLEGLIEGSGGYLDSDSLAVEIVTDRFDRPLVLIAGRHRLRFHDGSYLEFAVSVDADLDAIDYSFHYGRDDGLLIWRLDKHVGHEHEDGRDTHLHLADGRRQPSGEVDLDDVLRRIHYDRTGGADSG